MLNMRSSSEDLSTQARIRNAAVEHFARDGFQKTSLRAIAASAGVSAALVIHHYGSKEKLRAVCDEYVLNVLIRRSRDDAQPAGMADVLREFLEDPDEYRQHVQYMARAIEEDAESARTFVTAMVDEAEAIVRAGVEDGTMRPTNDPRALAVLNVLISLATLTMPPPLARALGAERFGPEVLQRMTLPTLELYTHGLYTDDTALEAAKKAWAQAKDTS